MSLGAKLTAINTAAIARYGVSVTRKRRPATDGAAVTSATLTALVSPLSAKEASALAVEGIANVMEENPHLFIFAAGSDVEAATDWLEWNGDAWRVLNATQPPVAGATAGIDLKVYCVRERAA